jgi:hypothetical protein
MAGVKVIATQETMQQIAQQLVCWGGAESAQQILYRTDGNLPYFEIPAGVCDGAPALTLTPGGTVITCPDEGATTFVQPTDAEVSGVNPNNCELIEAPSGLAVDGVPTTTAITVDWTAPDGTAPTGYRVAYRADGSTGAWTYIAVPAGTTTATATGLTADTDYDFKVQALHGTYSSAFTSPDVTISTAAA